MTLLRNLAALAGVLLISITFSLSSVSGGAAHPGGLNAEGCHAKKATNKYHCHNASGKSGKITSRSGEAKASNRTTRGHGRQAQFDEKDHQKIRQDREERHQENGQGGYKNHQENRQG